MMNENKLLEERYTTATLGLSLALLIGSSAPVHAEEICPTPETTPALDSVSVIRENTGIVDNAVAADHIQIETDSVELTRLGESIFRGDVEIRRAERLLRADEARFNYESGRLRLRGRVEYGDPDVKISGTTADFLQQTQAGTLGETVFSLIDEAGRGTAGEITTSGGEVLTLRDVTYTTCPIDNETWRLYARELEIDNARGRGTGRGVKLTFKGVPLIYLPRASFPTKTERKSGFLTPDLGFDDRSGTSLRVPYYINLAPSRDLTLTPRWLSRRGLQWQTEFRYLAPNTEGILYSEYLRDDSQTGTNRAFLHYASHTELARGWGIETDLNDVSDSTYFEDFGNSTAVSSIDFLQREVIFRYRSREWQFFTRFQNLQTIDESIPRSDRPYRRLPQLVLSGTWPVTPGGLDLELASELVNFQRPDNSVTGVRLDFRPRMIYRFQRPGYYVEPRLAWRYTQDELSNVPVGEETSPSFNAPIFSLDAGATFERGASDRTIQILEPRVLYTYIPFREQQDLPIFDTDLADFNRVQLFRENRFIGGDRLGDTSQVAFGITGRLLSRSDGHQVFGLTLGQILFLQDREVSLTANQPQDTQSSDLVVEGAFDVARSWDANLGIRYDPDTSDVNRVTAIVRFRPWADAALNLGYRFLQDEVEQTDVSFAWPLRDRWRIIGRWNFSIEERETLDQLFGVDYERCCWGIRVAWRRFITNRSGEEDGTIFFQLELKGLSSVGRRAEGFLERGILSY